MIYLIADAIITFNSTSDKLNFTQTANGKSYKNLNYPIQFSEYPAGSKKTENLRDQINFPIKYEKMITTVYDRIASEAGLVYTDKDGISKQNKVIGYLVKKIGSSILKGESIMSISLPVNIFDKRTLLQVLAYEMSLAPYFLPRAFYSNTPIEKLKWVTAFFISALHLSPLQMKPFSPTIGETYQASIGDLDIYVEQTVHKPITYNFYMTSKLYKIYGNITTDAATGANSVKAKKTGEFIVELLDGSGSNYSNSNTNSKYKFYFPNVHIHGITFGSRTFNLGENSLICDENNNLASLIKMNADKKGAIVSLFSKAKFFPDYIKYISNINF